VVLRNNHSSDPNLVDGKVFLIGFMKLGYEARARIKSHTMEKQRKVHNEREQERERKLHLASQRNAIIVNPEFTEEDRLEAIKKIKAAAVNYDKNSPGSVTMEAFDAAYLTPGMFKEVLKRSLNINFTEPELASMLSEYDNGRSNVNTQAFMVSFIKLGTDERDKVKAIQLTKQRRMNYLRKTEHERKMAESEEKMTLSIEYDYTEEERESAFAKLAFASKKYDKSHPGSMSLDGFEEKHLKAHVFREMLKRTFNVILTNEELASVMHYFDKKRTGTVFSKKFLIYFLKVGITEREKDHRASMQKLREDATNRGSFIL
jgi:Ca2+-binding EF-hand superfamily protein